MNVLAGIEGLSFSLPDLYQQVSNQGWQIKKLKFDKSNDRFLATAQASHGEELEAWGPTDRIAVANLLHNIVVRNNARMGKLSMWHHTFTNQLEEIAQAYSKAPLYEPKAAIAFMELARDSESRAKALTEHLEIVIVNNPDPYPNAQKMFDDIRKRRKLEVSRASVHHPIWSEEQVIAYRICHDVLGYCASGGKFDWEGENRAFAAHAAVLPVEAQKALFTESVAQTAYATYYRAYGPQKVALFPDFMDPAQEAENPHGGFRGIHPSQMFAPLERPAVKPLVAHVGPGDLDPRIELETPQEAFLRVSGPSKPPYYDPSQPIYDPNDGWTSGVDPLPTNAYLHHGDPLQSDQVRSTAQLIDTEWAYLNQDDPADLARMKNAIVNAFRVVLLSPRKDLRWNAVHYQDIANIPGDEDDPNVYWNTLERARQSWNVKRFGEDARFSHIPYFKQWRALERLIYDRDPQMGWEYAVEQADRFIQRLKHNIQDRIMAEDEDKPEEKRTPAFRIDVKANYEVSKALKAYLKGSIPDADYDIPQLESLSAVADPETMAAPDDQVPDMSRYGAFMGSHLMAIAQISQHVDEILKAALYDVHVKNGEGWHFRAQVLSLGISGVGPKVCSFAWLLLQPMTSQLGTIDTHMMDVLGHSFEKDSNNRDYFKFERELAAGRDAAGYGHVPLGQFQWGMWDYKRTGPGSHQDHSAMRVLDPVPHDQIDWAKKQQPINAQQAQAWKESWQTQPPDWWAATLPARQAVADQWDQTVAPAIARNKIPFNNGAPYQVYSKIAGLSRLTPWFVDPVTSQRINGQMGQTLMQHLMTTMGHSDVRSVWAQDYQVGKGQHGTVAKVPSGSRFTTQPIPANRIRRLDNTGTIAKVWGDAGEAHEVIATDQEAEFSPGQPEYFAKSEPEPQPQWTHIAEITLPEPEPPAESESVEEMRQAIARLAETLAAVQQTREEPPTPAPTPAAQPRRLIIHRDEIGRMTSIEEVSET